MITEHSHSAAPKHRQLVGTHCSVTTRLACWANNYRFVDFPSFKMSCACFLENCPGQVKSTNEWNGLNGLLGRVPTSCLSLEKHGPLFLFPILTHLFMNKWWFLSTVCVRFWYPPDIMGSATVHNGDVCKFFEASAKKPYEAECSAVSSIIVW